MTESGYFYQCSGGESFDSIALEMYGDEKYAAQLICANAAASSTLVFKGGEVLTLPVIEKATPNSSGGTAAPWKE